MICRHLRHLIFILVMISGNLVLKEALFFVEYFAEKLTFKNISHFAELKASFFHFPSFGILGRGI